jgi:hypothetical protein
MPVSDQQIITLAHAHQARLDGVAARLRAMVLAWWDQWQPISSADQDGFAGSVTTAVDAAKTAAVNHSTLYIGAVASLAGVAFTAPDLRAILAGHRGGVPTGEVWGRPTVTTRTALAAGRTVTDALAAGRARVERLAADDVAIAGRDGTHAAMRGTAGVVAYRRVTDGKACMFCLVASTQTYHVADLMPLHEHCGCVAAAIIGESDPGRIIDRELYGRLKESGQLAEFNRARERRTRHSVDAELGARLVTTM